MTLPTAKNAGLHVRYEKAGLVLDALPIPWNADAVIIEANVRLPKGAPRQKQDFALRLANGQPVPAELIVPGNKREPIRILFRVPPPPQTCQARVFWRDRPLGEAELPIVTAAEFAKALALQMPTAHVVLAGQTAAGRTFVTTQAKSVFATALLQSATPLAPVIDLDLHVEVHQENGGIVGTAAATFTAEQLRLRQALVSVMLPKLKRIGSYQLSWQLGSLCLHAHRLEAISRRTFLRSLRISATRFVVQNHDGALQVVRWLPHRDGRLVLDGIARVSPCFYVTSSAAEMAGLAPFTLRALTGDVLTTLAIKDDVLVTDGPTPLLLGAVAASDLARIKYFTLASGDFTLGNLPLLPAPSADFTAEGGFAPLDDFLWSAAADEQLKDRLGKLLGDE
jgi:hypothetical protein